MDLREQNPLYNGAVDSQAEIFYAVAIVSRWMPQCAVYDYDRAIGICFMRAAPVGTPVPLECEPWAADYKVFKSAFKKKYSRDSERHLHDDWDAHLVKHMPTIVGADGVHVPSDKVFFSCASYATPTSPPDFLAPATAGG